MHVDRTWWLTPAARRGWVALLLALALFICWLAFSPAPPPSADVGWDKANHALAFATLAVVAELAFWPAHARRRRISIGLVAFGGFIELVQAQIPARSGDWADVAADATGIAIGIAMVALVHRRARHRS